MINHLSAPITLIARDPLDYLTDYLEEAKDAEPASASRWLLDFLPRVQSIYSFQILNGCRGLGWYLVRNLMNTFHSEVRGIIHADAEGFSNEYGDYITWDFSERAHGKADMAVLTPTGNWQRFRMDLGNPAHREAFMQGLVPPGLRK